MFRVIHGTFCCFVFLLTPSLANRLSIDVKPETFRLKDKDVTVTCSSNKHIKTTMHGLEELRLRKLDEDGRGWTNIAAYRTFDGSIKTMAAGVMATGTERLGYASGYRLSVAWPEVTSDIYGKYRCDGDLRLNINTTIKIQSAELAVWGMSTDTVQLHHLLRMFNATGVYSRTAEMSEMLNVSFSNLLSKLDTKFEALKDQIDKTKPTASQVKITANNDIDWPEGDFTLLMPDTGCPLKPPSWDRGLMKLMDVDVNAYHPLNAPSHFPSPFSRNGFTHQQFCSLRNSTWKRGKPWPPGSYCLGTFSSCPSGFNMTSVHIGLPVNINNKKCYGTIPGRCSSLWNAWQTFCCRHDVAHDTPIELPTAHPFYLYRHKGTCQQVKDMNVTQDMFLLNTVHKKGRSDVDIRDKWMAKYAAEYRPDGSLGPFSVELCYYSKWSL